MKIKRKIKSLFLCIIGLFCIIPLITLASCSNNTELSVEKFELVTSPSELNTTSEIRFKITLSNPNSFVVDSCEITKNESEATSYAVESATGKTDTYYVTVPNYVHEDNNKFSLTKLSYLKESGVTELSFNTKMYLKTLVASTEIVSTIEVSELEVNESDVFFGETIEYSFAFNNTIDQDGIPRYVDITFKATIIEETETKEVVVTRKENYIVESSNNYYTTSVKTPTEAEFDLQYSGTSENISWKTYVSRIKYGSANDTVELNTDSPSASLKMKKSLFSIANGTTNFNFSSSTNFDVNGYLFLGVGSKFPYLTLQVKNKNEYEITGLIMNDYVYTVGSGSTLNKVQTGQGISTITIADSPEIYGSNPEGIVVQGITYIDNLDKQVRANFTNPFVYSDFAVYSTLADTVKKLFVSEFEEISNGNVTITSDIILTSDIVINSANLSNTIFNGDYIFAGTIEGNGHTITITDQTKPLFLENHGTIKNLILKGTMNATNYSQIEGNETIIAKTGNPFIVSTNYGTIRNVSIQSNFNEKNGDNGIVSYPMIVKTNEVDATIEDIEISSNLANFGINNKNNTSYYFGMITNKGMYQRIVFNTIFADTTKIANVIISSEAYEDSGTSSMLFMQSSTYDLDVLSTLVNQNVLYKTSSICKINMVYKERILALINKEKANPNSVILDSTHFEAFRTSTTGAVLEAMPWLQAVIPGSTSSELDAYAQMMQFINNYYNTIESENYTSNTFLNAGFGSSSAEYTDDSFWHFTGQGITQTAVLKFTPKKHKK